ncbi:MAG: acyltransferase domain-containing protein [Candidatus Babeliales bacterium]
MKVVMVFPGYSSQFVGMAKELYDESRLIQEYFEEASNCLNRNFVKLCFASSESELRKIDNAYLSIFLVSSSIAKLLMADHGIIPDYVAGYGIGEYSAICAVDGFSLPDGLYFLLKYAQFYQEFLSTHDIKSVMIKGMLNDEIQELCSSLNNEKIDLSVVLSESSTIVGGFAMEIESLQQKLADKKVKITEVPAQMGLYSSLMQEVVTNLKAYLEKIDFKDLSVPLLSSINAKFIKDGKSVKNYVLEAITSTIYWNKTIQKMEKSAVIIQIGPGSIEANELQEHYPDKKIISINKPSDIDLLKDIIETTDTKSEQPES